MDEKFTKRFESFKNSLAHDYDGTIDRKIDSCGNQ